MLLLIAGGVFLILVNVIVVLLFHGTARTERQLEPLTKYPYSGSERRRGQGHAFVGLDAPPQWRTRVTGERTEA